MRHAPSLFLLIASFAALHLYRISDGPNGFHQWRESDTAVVALNFSAENADFFRPRIDARGLKDGVVGMELPIYCYATALLYRVLGFSHAWPRLLTLLAAILVLVGLARLVTRVSGDRTLAWFSVYCAAFSPLFFLYARSLQPDMMGLALAIWGLERFLAWLEQEKTRDFLLCPLLLAAAGGIKPLFLGLGLPMAWMTWRRGGALAFRGRRLWSIAIFSLGPVFLWMWHAKRLTERFGAAFFYAPGPGYWANLRSALHSPFFYQHVFGYWIWKLAIGLPAFAAFLYGLAHARRFRGSDLFLGWIVGAYIVFLLAAEQCCRPHDYYVLISVPAFAVFSAIGILKWSEKGRAGKALASLVLLALPVLALRHFQKSLGAPYDFAAGRAMAERYLPKDALVVNVTPAPESVLYRLGRRGWQLWPLRPDRALPPQARYLATGWGSPGNLSPLSSRLGPELYEDQGIRVFPILGHDPAPSGALIGQALSIPR